MKTAAQIVIPCYEADVTAIVRLERHFEPDARQGLLYVAWCERDRPLGPLVRECLKGLRAPVQ